MIKRLIGLWGITGLLWLLTGCGAHERIKVSDYPAPKAPVAARDSIIVPPALQPGDTVMIVAPAGYVSNRNGYIERADSLLRAWHLVPVHGPNLMARYYSFAGTDAQRLADLQAALDNPSVKAIWAARGGYGSVRILDSIDWSGFEKHPKWLIGFSDITVLLNALYINGYASIHGIMPISLAHPNTKRKPALVTLKNLMFGKQLSFRIPADTANIRGEGEGELIGGNLSMLVSLLGSPQQLDTRGKILFLEDVDEYPYVYDRLLYALARAGYFDHLAGLLVGDFSAKHGNEAFGENIRQMILKHTRGKGYPVVFGFPAGHVVKNYALPFGKRAHIKVTRRRVTITY